MVIDTEELACLSNIAKHTVRGIPQGTDDKRDLVVFIGSCNAWMVAIGLSHMTVTRLTREERPAEEELSQHTAQGPHVNGLTVGQAQDHLWSPAGRGESMAATTPPAAQISPVVSALQVGSGTGRGD